MRRKATMKYKSDLTLQDLEGLLPAVLFGAEGDEGDNSNEGDEGQDQNQDDAGSSDDGDDNEGNSSNEEHDDADDEKVKGLKSALTAERKRAAVAEKKLKLKEKAEADAALAKKSEIEQAQIREQKALERAEKLANGFLQRSLGDAIRSAANDLNFIDADDALQGIDRTKLEYTQDDEDPSKVEVDLKSVEREVKRLASKKPHFVKSGTDDGEPTGSQFGGSRKKKTTNEDQLRQKYSALQGGV